MGDELASRLARTKAAYEAQREETGKLLARISQLEAEANRLTNRVERAEAGLERIAGEPPDRGVTLDFREYARAVLLDISKEGGE